MAKKVRITDRVKSFDDACSVLGLDPNNLPVVDHLPEKDRRSIVAYYKLTVIIRALNEGWEPSWSDWSERKYFNWFYVNSAGFACAGTLTAASSTNTSVGSRLCYKSENTARYAREQFLELYAEYLFIELPKIAKQ